MNYVSLQKIYLLRLKNYLLILLQKINSNVLNCNQLDVPVPLRIIIKLIKILLIKKEQKISTASRETTFRDCKKLFRVSCTGRQFRTELGLDNDSRQHWRCERVLARGDRTIVASPSRSGVTWHPGYTPLLHTPPDKRGAIAVRDTIVRHRVLVHACVRTQRVSHGQAIKDNNVRDVYNATIAVTSVAKLFQPAWLRLIRAISRDSFYHCFPAWRGDDRYRRLISHDWCPRKLRRGRTVIKIATNDESSRLERMWGISLNNVTPSYMRTLNMDKNSRV